MDEKRKIGRSRMPDLILDHCKSKYEELCGIWRDIERKAQGTVALASGLLAAGFAFIRFFEFPSDTIEGLAAIALLFFFLTIVLSMISLLIDEVECMDDSKEMRKAYDRIQSEGEDSKKEDEFSAFLKEHFLRWEEINDDLHKANSKKSGWVLWSQRSLLGAILIMSAAIALVLFCVG